MPFHGQKDAFVAPVHAPVIRRLARIGKLGQLFDMTLSPLARFLALMVAVMALASLGADFVSSRASHPDDSVLATLWRMARFFTILTNLMVGVTYLALAARGRVASAVWLGGVTLWIGITGVVYHLLLAGAEGPKSGIDWWANFGLHGAVPVAVALWWLAFGPRQGLSVTAALIWMIWPLTYVIYALGRGQLDGVYPYFFTNPDRIGWIGVGRWTVILAVSFFVAGLLQIAMARLVRR